MIEGSTKEEFWSPVIVACASALGIGLYVWTTNTLAVIPTAVHSQYSFVFSTSSPVKPLNQ